MSAPSREQMLARLILVAKAIPVGDAEVSFRSRENSEQDNEDFPSIVGIIAPSDKYTDDDLARLSLFAEEVTSDFDKRHKSRSQANLYLFDKIERRHGWIEWKASKSSWTYEARSFRDLKSAILFMTRMAETLRE